MRQVYVKETDERRRHINEKVGSTGINALIVIFSLAMLIANYYSLPVFLTLLAVTIITVLLKLGLGLYYDKRV